MIFEEKHSIVIFDLCDNYFVTLVMCEFFKIIHFSQKIVTNTIDGFEKNWLEMLKCCSVTILEACFYSFSIHRHDLLKIYYRKALNMNSVQSWNKKDIN